MRKKWLFIVYVFDARAHRSQTMHIEWMMIASAEHTAGRTRRKNDGDEYPEE